VAREVKVPGFTDGWKLAPAWADHADEMDKKLTACEWTVDGTVGSEIPADSPASVSCFDVALELLAVNAGRWAEFGGKPLALGKKHGQNSPIWVDRTALIDPRYQETIDRIDGIASAEATELREKFWPKRRADIESSERVTLPEPSEGISGNTGQRVQVPAGEYKKRAIREDAFGLPNSAPFYIVINVPGTGLVGISPAALEGTASPTGDQPAAPSSQAQVTAAAIRAAFAAAPEHIRRFIPDGEWLTDQQIHYVEPDEMGAAYVLERAPLPAEVGTVKQNQQTRDHFVTGSSLPGLRLRADIFIQKTMTGTGTEYHEAVHQRSHDAFRRTFGNKFNEGATEYFTRILVSGPAQRRELVRNDSPYEPQRASVTALVKAGVITEPDLANAYFAGALEPLFAGFDTATGGQLSFQAYLDRQENATAHIATELLEQAVAAAKPRK